MGEPVHTCEMCGNECVRYVHVMEHPDHPEQLEVGCVCAEKMAAGYDGKDVERGLKNRAKRRANWPRNGWRLSARGNYYRKKYDRLFTVGECDDGSWWGRDEAGWLPRTFPTMEAAMLALFDRNHWL